MIRLAFALLALVACGVVAIALLEALARFWNSAWPLALIVVGLIALVALRAPFGGRF